MLVYAALWTVVLLPFGDVAAGGRRGRFLSQLLWFAGVHLLVSSAAPVTAWWAARRPLLVLGVWLLLIAGVDAVRWSDGPSWVGWLNLLLVGAGCTSWGTASRSFGAGPGTGPPRAALALGAAALLAAAVALALFGPYSSSLVTIGGDSELSNLSPPTLVLALYGAGQVLLLVVLWPALAAFLSDDRRWAVVALVGARGIGIYLWHIPSSGVPPRSHCWWGGGGPAQPLVVGGAPARRRGCAPFGLADRRCGCLGRPSAGSGSAAVAAARAVAAVGAGPVVLNISVTGFATWAGSGMLGLWSSSLLNLVLLLLCWQAVGQVEADA